MNMTLKEIYEEFSINGRYSRDIKIKNFNKNLIREIYDKNEEIKTIEILNKKYIDLLIILRDKYLNKFTNDIYEKVIKNCKSKEDAEIYRIGIVSNLLSFTSLISAPRTHATSMRELSMLVSSPHSPEIYS